MGERFLLVSSAQCPSKRPRKSSSTPEGVPTMRVNATFSFAFSKLKGTKSDTRLVDTQTTEERERERERRERERERGQKADTRLIVATAAILLYRSFAKVRQFAFSSRTRQRGGRRTPPPDNIFDPLHFSSTIFSSHL